MLRKDPKERDMQAIILLVIVAIRNRALARGNPSPYCGFPKELSRVDSTDILLVM